MKQEGEEYRRVWERALRLLNYRERSRKEITDKLSGKRFSPAVITAVVERLEQLGLLDDAAFARLWVRSRLRFKPRSIWLLERELREKGIEEETARKIIAEELPPGWEREAVRELAEKRMRYYRTEKPAAARRKLFAYLGRRGFSPDMIRECISTLIRFNDKSDQF